MNRTLRITTIVSLAVIPGFFVALHANPGGRVDAQTLFANARSLADMMAPGTPPYLLRIRVAGVGQLSGYPGGSYEVQFASPAEFRQDRVFGQVRFSFGAHGDAKKKWMVQDETPPGLLHDVFMRAMSYTYGATALDLPSGAKVKVKRRAERGLIVDCAEEGKAVHDEVCFDATTGTVLTAQDSVGFLYQFSDFRPWGAHLVPGKIVVFAGNAPVLEANIEVLEALPSSQLGPSPFVPPAGSTTAQSEKACDFEQARLIEMVRPTYPLSAGSPTGDGTVLLWGEIDKAGRVSAVIVVHSAGSAFDQAALEAVKQWRYSPAILCGEPIENASSFRVAFR